MQKINLYFDFDGTLFDSKKGISLAVKKSAKEVYNVDCDLSDKIIGPPISIIHDSSGELVGRDSWHKNREAFIHNVKLPLSC